MIVRVEEEAEEIRTISGTSIGALGGTRLCKMHGLGSRCSLKL